MSVPDVALLLHVSRPTVYRMIAAGELRALRLGHRPGRGQMLRIAHADLIAYLAEQNPTTSEEPAP